MTGTPNADPVVAYFTNDGYFAVVVNFCLPSVKHLDDITRPLIGATVGAGCDFLPSGSVLVWFQSVLLSQGISLLLVHHSASLTT